MDLPPYGSVPLVLQKNIIMGDYEDLYDFTQDLTAALPTE